MIVKFTEKQETNSHITKSRMSETFNTKLAGSYAVQNIRKTAHEWMLTEPICKENNCSEESQPGKSLIKSCIN